MGLCGWMRACKDGAQTRPHSVNGLGVSGPISALRAIARRISPCSRAGGTQMVGRPVERTAASVLVSHTRLTACPRLCRPTASATTAGQSPPPRALIRATIEKGPAGGVLGIQSSTTNAASPIPYKNLCSSALAFQKSAVSKSPVNTDGTYRSRPDPAYRAAYAHSARSRCQQHQIGDHICKCLLLARNGHADCIGEFPFLGAKRKTFARI